MRCVFKSSGYTPCKQGKRASSFQCCQINKVKVAYTLAILLGLLKDNLIWNVLLGPTCITETRRIEDSKLVLLEFHVEGANLKSSWCETRGRYQLFVLFCYFAPLWPECPSARLSCFLQFIPKDTKDESSLSDTCISNNHQGWVYRLEWVLANCPDLIDIDRLDDLDDILDFSRSSKNRMFVLLKKISNRLSPAIFFLQKFLKPLNIKYKLIILEES